MFCPRCNEFLHPIESDFDSSEVRAFCRCSACGLEFFAIFIFDHNEIETEPHERPHYQTETERDNPRDPVIEK